MFVHVVAPEAKFAVGPLAGRAADLLHLIQRDKEPNHICHCRPVVGGSPRVPGEGGRGPLLLRGPPSASADAQTQKKKLSRELLCCGVVLGLVSGGNPSVSP